MEEYSIGLDLGGTNLRAAAIRRDGTMLDKVSGKTPYSESREQIVRDMVEAISVLRTRFGKESLAGIGIGVPGFISLEDGVIRNSGNLSSLEDFPIREEIERQLGTTVILENDANAAALGEKWNGAGRDVNDLIMLTLGTGIGGGIISGGKVLRGFSGMAGELGHITAVPYGNPCACGNNGCVEKHGSATAISAQAHLMGLGHGLSARQVYEMAKAGNEKAKLIFTSVGESLGIVLAMLVNAFNFPLYLISGGVIGAWDEFSPAMFAEVTRRSFTFRSTKTRIEKAQLGNEAGLYGAAYLPGVKTNMWLGLDIGTGGSRALVVNGKGEVIAAHTAEHEEMLMLHPLWAEQRPENWWDASVRAIQGALAAAGVRGSEIQGIGLSGQMHGLVVLDSANAVLRPSLIWCDQRSQTQVDWVNAKLGKARVLECIANPMLTGFTLPKLLWVRDNEPGIYEQVRKVLLPKDYIRFRLTGEFATEVSDASGTALFDVLKRRWSYELADAVGVDRSVLPTCYESSDITSKISREVAELTGLKEGTPVVGGGGDQAASAVGNGIVSAGIVSCTLGTSGVVFAHMEEVAYDPAGRVHTFCHAVRGKWHVMGVTQGAGLSLQWFRNQLAAGTAYSDLTAEAATAPAGSDGLYWLPYLMGERTPHLDAQARGGWIGMTARHRRAEMIRSLIEGVTYSQKDCLDIVASLGVEIASVRASGGGATSPFWRQILADIFDQPVVTLASQEGSALGAALLAMVGTGEYASVPEVCGAVVRESARLEPREENRAVYAKGHGTFQALYPALRDLYPRM